MGCCLGTSAASDYSDDYENERSFPLSHEQIKWKSKEPMTEAQLTAKRQEFWETSPAFEGRQEIWDALRAAATHAEMGDFTFAQAIIDGANIFLPYGSLMESYDELGCRYVLPNFCLSQPTNLIDEDSNASRKSFADEMQSEERKARGSQSRCSLTKSRQRYCCVGCSGRKAKAKRKKPTKGRCRQNGSRTERGGQCSYRPVLSIDECSQLVGVGSLVRLRLRLSSTGAEILFDAGLKEPIGRLKWRLHYLYGESQSVYIPTHQRWLYGGRLLTDKLTVEQCRIAPQFVIQVVISVVSPIEATVSSTKEQFMPVDNEVDLGDVASPTQPGHKSIQAAQIETHAETEDRHPQPSVSLNIAELTGTVRLNPSFSTATSHERPAQCTSAQNICGSDGNCASHSAESVKSGG